jgi:hypothetical protein
VIQASFSSTITLQRRFKLNFDPTPENLAELPPLTAVTPVPEWAKKEAAKLGLL